LRGRRRSSRVRRILIDTTFLLPALGIEVEPEALEAIKYFHDLRVHYLEASLLEALWRMLKLVSEDGLELVRIGIEAIRTTYHRLDPPAEAHIEAYRLYHEGHRDYIDNLLYSTSKTMNLPLLTIDRELRDFIEMRGHPTENLISLSDLLKSLNP